MNLKGIVLQKYKLSKQLNLNLLLNRTLERTQKCLQVPQKCRTLSLSQERYQSLRDIKTYIPKSNSGRLANESILLKDDFYQNVDLVNLVALRIPAHPPFHEKKFRYSMISIRIGVFCSVLNILGLE